MRYDSIINLRVSKNTKEQISKFEAETGVKIPVAEICREALNNKLKELEKKFIKT